MSELKTTGDQKDQEAIEEKQIVIGEVYEAPKEGSLGLLALGYQGLKLWREAQQKAEKSDKKNIDG